MNIYDLVFSKKKRKKPGKINQKTNTNVSLWWDEWEGVGGPGGSFELSFVSFRPQKRYMYSENGNVKENSKPSH